MKRAPYFVLAIRRDGKFQGYEVWLGVKAGQPRKVLPLIAGGPRLKRHEVYAVAKLLNAQKSVRKWAEKFDDPYA